MKYPLFSSNRPGHVFAAIAVGTLLTTVAISQRNHGLLVTAATIPIWELIATPDVDIDTRSPRRGPWYRRLWVLWWKPYAKMVSHRSRWSHSLLLGLPARFFCGPLIFLVLPVLLLPGPQRALLISFYVAYWPWVLRGCLISDALHLLKDGYGLREIIFGK